MPSRLKLLNFDVYGRLEAGVDEAGRGCLAGPVTAAAVIPSAATLDLALNDSKKLSPSARKKLRMEIERTAVAWAVGWASSEEVDQVNILNATFLAMHRAIDGLRTSSGKPSPPAHLLIDGNRFAPHAIDHTCHVKGDGKFASIAAASILAKTHRDAFMTESAEQFPHYGWMTNAGYPTIAHRKAIAAHGPTPLHRKTFRWQAKLF